VEDEKEATAGQSSDITDGNRARDLPARLDSVLEPHLSRPNLYIHDPSSLMEATGSHIFSRQTRREDCTPG